MKKITLLVFFGFVALSLAKAQTPYYIKMTESEMIRNPESWMVDFSKAPKWSYCQGLELGAILDVWKKTADRKYYDYSVSYADTMINDKGEILTYVLEKYNIDMINSGKMLFPVYAMTKNPKYRKAIELLRSQMKTHPRISTGGFWHKKIYPHQVWLDGLYMAGPFLAEYAYTFNEPELFDDVALQLIDAYKDTYDSKTGLLYHGYDESRKQRWADKKTGHSPNFWSRSMGWYMMALVDVLDYFPQDHPRRGEILKILNDLSASLEKFRDAKTGMWYQVTNMGNKKGNYLESTGSAMFIYTWVKGAQLGYLPSEYITKGIEAYDQFVRQFVVDNPDGTISITDACSVAGLGGEPKYRDGSFQYYISEPVRDNDAKVVGPFIKLSLLLNK